MSVSDNLRTIIQLNSKVLEEGLAEGETLTGLTRAHNHIGDFAALHLAIQDRPEAALFGAGITEYQYGLVAASCGQYRHAFMSLRLAYELMLATVHFSAHEIKYRRWALSTSDIVWSALADENEGVFAHNFISAFFPDAAPSGRQFRALASTLYREMSEYVHGNAGTHEWTKEGVKFDPVLAKEWFARADTARLTVLFAYSCRFLPHIEAASKTALEPFLLPDLGHLPPIRALFEAVP